MNIVSFEAVEEADGVAVDQLLVELDAEDAARIPAVLDSLPDVQVELFRPVPLPAASGGLDLIESLAHASDDRVLEQLVDGAPVVVLTVRTPGSPAS